MKIEIPTNCPCCNYTLETVNEQLFCRNTSCGAQLYKKLEHFCKVLSIKGMGPKTIEKLDLADITELFYLDFDATAQALGSEKVAEKLLLEIEKAKSADLATVLAAFSIPLVGATASAKLCAVVDHIDNITQDKCKQAGLGEKVTANILNWLETEYQELKEFLPFSFRSSGQVTGNDTQKQTVCITGKLISFKTKSDAAEVLSEAGYKVVESVTKSLNFLVDESNDNSTKRKKADQYGIEIISNLNQFLKETQ